MTRTAGWLRFVAFGLVILLGIVTAMFFFGYALADLESSVAAALAAAWIVPVAVLGWLALARPDTALWVLVGVAAVIVVAFLVNGAVQFLPEAWGPVREVVAVGFAVATGFLGLKRATPAGWLLLGVLVWMILPRVLGMFSSGEFHGFGGPASAIAVPLLLAALLFLAAAAAKHHTPTPHAHA